MNLETARNEIKRHLWGWGFSVRDVNGIAPYDLLVNKKWKISIVMPGIKTESLLYLLENCDVVATVIANRRPLKSYASASNFKKEGYVAFKTFIKNPKYIFEAAEKPIN
jgi:hypothetical protein